MNFQRQTANTFGFALLVVTFVGGCVAPYVAPNAALPDPPVTYWNKLGIPQAGAGLRDNFLNGGATSRVWKPSRLCCVWQTRATLPKASPR